MSSTRRPRWPAWVLAASCFAIIVLLAVFGWRGDDDVRAALAGAPSVVAGGGVTPRSPRGPVEGFAGETRDPLRVGDVRRAVRAPNDLMAGQPRETREWAPGAEGPPVEEWDAEELDLEEGEEYRDPEWGWPEDEEPAEDEEPTE